ncbi:torsin-1B [Caerostris darwini]|uniref:Torsin-1B n=1 Tax=Caerostris darwini TaxID=1538125 RepID=A0AAV4P9A1_9ARAC|nr:torsin-1B [Caerostris darwini]
MYKSYIYTSLFLLISISPFSYGADPFSGIYALGAVGISGGLALYQYVKCKYVECCDDQWINLKLNILDSDLEHKLFGQHLVKRIILNSLKSHVSNDKPKKALVMSFHGWNGGGKNYVTQMIVKNLFKKSTDSSYYHFYFGSRDFPHKHDVYKYQDRLRNDIEKATKNCGRSMFVFDEVDKMAPDVLDSLKPYIDFHPNFKGTDYRKNIFIFLSNTGGSNITKVALKFWSEGKTREDIALKDVEPIIIRNAYNEAGGLFRSELIKKDLIDVYVPFLPLEKKHIKKCAFEELRSRGLKTDSNTVNNIVDQLIYDPPEIELFSTSGCKKISHKVNIFGDDF